MDEKQLYRLIREAREKADDWPDLSEDLLMAYLLRTASAKQKTQVRRSLATSASLRRELLDLQQHLLAIQTEEAKAAFDAVEVPPLQSGARPSPEIDATRSVWEKMQRAVGDMFASHRLALVMSTAGALLLLITIYPRLKTQPFPLIPEFQQDFVDAELLRRAQSDTRELPSREDVMAVAMRSFGECLSKDALSLRPEPALGTAATNNVQLHIQILDAANGKKVLQDFSFVLPNDIEIGRNEILVWILPLHDSTDLPRYRYEISAPEVALRWQDSSVRQGVLSVTVKSGGEWTALECRPIRFD